MTDLKEARVQVAVADKLKQRGIFEAAQANKCRIVGNTLEIPLFDFDGSIFAYRSKNFSPKAKPKYFWTSGEKPNHDLRWWYILPTAPIAIKSANGVCYLANGSPATLASFAFKVYNTICTTLSEISIPDNLITVLEHLGIKELRYLADNDCAGWDSAIKWRDALLGSDIEFKAYTWGKDLKPKIDVRGSKDHPYMACDDVSEKYDANDLWIDSQFDIQIAQEKLSNLTRLILPQPEVKQKRVYESSSETPDDIFEEIKSRLGLSGVGENSLGFSTKNVLCLFHEDTDPSAGLKMRSDSASKAGGMSCFRCGWHNWKDVAAALNIKLPELETKSLAHDEEYQAAKAAYDKKKLEEAKANPQRCGLFMYDKPAAPGYSHYVPVPTTDNHVTPDSDCSWINQEHLPVAWVSDILSLTDGRSAVMRVMLEMHRAIRDGQLNSQCFTKKDIVDGLDLPRKSTEAALETLLDWGFVSILDTIYIYTIDTSIATISTQNSGGRPSTQYRVETNTDMIRALLSDMMRRYLIETNSKKTLAPRHMTFASDIGLSHSDYKAWSARTDSIVEKRVKATIETEIAKCNEAIWSDLYYPIDLESVTGSKDIRSQLLQHFLNQPGREKGIQITDDRLARFLGCTTGNLSAIYQAANVTTEKRYKRYEVENCRECRIDEEISKAQKQHQGAATAIMFKKVSDGKWSGMIFGQEKMEGVFYANRTNMARLFIHVEQPSLKRFKTEDEIKAELKPAVQTEAEETIESTGEIEIAAEPVADKPKRNAPQRTTKDRDWTSHDRAWAFEQLRLEMHIFTDYKLLPGGKIIDNEGEIIKPHAELKDIVSYLNQVAKTALHSIDSFYNPEVVESETDILVCELEMLGGQERNEDTKQIAKPVEPLPELTWDYDPLDNPVPEVAKLDEKWKNWDPSRNDKQQKRWFIRESA